MNFHKVPFSPSFHKNGVIVMDAGIRPADARRLVLREFHLQHIAHIPVDAQSVAKHGAAHKIMSVAAVHMGVGKQSGFVSLQQRPEALKARMG